MGQAEDDGRVFMFLCGADMDPSAVLKAHPGARFVARARLARDGDDAGVGGEVWGILLRLPASGGAADEETARVETDDGRPFAARLVGDGHPSGDPVAIVAAARYWELPPAYVARLHAALDADTAGSDRD